ncbi:MAG: hypothetical protein QF506_04720 [Candidatus Woesearchaeota archaeon]|jgi:hypothetical protein|nr:hypothetical protein [Candidatus Woesearchaeota archaeon]|tara:strand:+ start:355 stop:576 length:222 start_codon:yes stop_codon:yes gene_type:complete
MPLDIQGVTLSLIIGTLFAIVYALRVLVLMERRMGRIELHIEKIAERIIREELKIERAIKRKSSGPAKRRKKR